MLGVWHDGGVAGGADGAAGSGSYSVDARHELLARCVLHVGAGYGGARGAASAEGVAGPGGG